MGAQKKRKDDVNILELAMNIATLTEQVQSQNKNFDKQDKRMEKLESSVNDLVKSFEVTYTRLFVDNGKLSIVSQFIKNDDDLAQRMIDVERKINNHILITETKDNVKKKKTA